MARGLKACGENSTNVAVVVNDKNVSQVIPRVRAWRSFCSIATLHQEPPAQSAASAGQYLVGLINELLKLAHSGIILPPDFTAAFFAIAVTIYFWHQNHGRAVTPLVVVSNDLVYAIARIAYPFSVDEVVMGASARFSSDSQLENFAMHWGSLGNSDEHHVKVRVLSEEHDIRAEI